jgi:hypothetical protein
VSSGSPSTAQSFALWPASTPFAKRLALQRYLDSLEKADEDWGTILDFRWVLANYGLI